MEVRLVKIIKDIISQDTTDKEIDITDMEIKNLPGINQDVIVVNSSSSISIKELANQACHYLKETRSTLIRRTSRLK